MMRRAKIPAAPELPKGAAADVDDRGEWEVRPGGMLVQKRNPGDPAAATVAAKYAPTIRVKVKYGSVYHEIYLSSQSTFGELKKLLSERIGVHPGDQKVVFKDKERSSSAYLDTSGVKDGSKMAVLEDAAAQAKRLLEARRQAKADNVAKSLSSVKAEVDRLAVQVSALETAVGNGGKVGEKDVLNLTEKLMTELIKLDGIAADGEAKLQRKMQVRRVQKYVETLDVIKMKNAMPMPSRNGQVHDSEPQHHEKRQPPPTPAQPVVVTTKWETFDSVLFTPSTSSASTATSATATPRLEWELF